ncbi:MAG: hypothetical protein QM759_02420 [Terricaulis sp.]
MVGVLALLTGWALLSPLLVMLLAFATGRYWPWMRLFLDISSSAPLLVFTTAAGFAMIFVGVRALSRQNEPSEPF